jgi:hypothetical protein
MWWRWRSRARNCKTTWVTPAAYPSGYYDKVYAALQHWVETEFPFSRPYYSNAAIPARSNRRAPVTDQRL